MYCNVPTIKYCVVLLALPLCVCHIRDMCVVYSIYNICYMIPNVSLLSVNVWVMFGYCV